MNWSRLTSAMIIALLVSGLCTYAVSRRMGARNAPQHVADQRYVAAARPLQAGELLKPDSLMFVSWPASKPISGAFTNPQDLVGRATLYPIDPGQPLTDKFVSAVGAGAGLAGRIPDGMRAIALRSDEVMGVAGFLLPGSHVDVLVTYRTDSTTQPTTATVLQNAEVLAAGHQVQPDPEGKPATVTVVTLLLTPDDAERAVLASTQGAVHFVLRSGSDTAKVAENPMMLSQLAGAPPAPSAAAAPAEMTHTTRVTSLHATRPPASRDVVVQTIMGDKQTTDTFERPGKQ